MKCAQVLDLSSRYLENDIDESTRQEIDQHLNECPDCQKEYRIFSDSMRILHAAVKMKPLK